MRGVPTPALGLALALAFALLAPPARAHEGAPSCSQVGDGWTCTFVCHAGDRLRVSAQSSGPQPDREFPRISATCGGETVTCQQVTRCTATSAGIVSRDDVGTCRALTVAVNGICESISAATLPASSATYASGPTSSPSIGPIRYGIGRTCAPAELVCVGPADPLVETPVIGPQPVAPAWSVGAWLNLTPPGAHHASLGPFPILGPPAPIVICAEGCPVPSSPRQTPAARVDASVTFGGERHDAGAGTP